MYNYKFLVQVVIILACFGCRGASSGTSDTGPGKDATTQDTGLNNDTGPDVLRDAAGDSTHDSGTGDAARDGSVDSGFDAVVDSGFDTGVDTGLDAMGSECGDGIVEGDEECEAPFANGQCVKCAATCDMGFADCNADLPADGCETDLTLDATCGSCVKMCAVDATCTDLSGTLTCVANRTVYPGPQGWDGQGDWLGGFWFTHPITLGNGVVTGLGIYTDETTGPFTNIKLALYTDNGGDAHNLVVESPTALQQTGETAIAVTHTNVSAGQYWIAAIGQQGLTIYGERDTSASPTLNYIQKGFSDPAPAVWPVADQKNYNNGGAYSIFVEQEVHE